VHSVDSRHNTKCAHKEQVIIIAHDAGKTKSEQSRFRLEMYNWKRCQLYHQSYFSILSSRITGQYIRHEINRTMHITCYIHCLITENIQHGKRKETRLRCWKTL